MTSTTILLGGTAPLSGPEIGYAPAARGAEAYFEYVNARGGVNGRKIVYKVIDDGYDPGRTVQATRQLVQQDRVFAIFNSVGTEHNLAIRPFLNQLQVPQLFVGSGAGAFPRERSRYPWTMGYLPSFFGEGAIYGRHIAGTRPRARIAVLHESSEYGKEMLAGLRKGLGGKGRIVTVETYQVTDVDVRSQVTELRSSRADTFMVFALWKHAVQAFIEADRLGWRPQVYLSLVSTDPFVMEIARRNTGNRTTEGTISIAFLKDATSPALAKDPGIVLYKKIMRRYLPPGKEKEVVHLYGMAVAFTMVDALKRAGKNLTRQGLLRAATHLNETNNPFLWPGIAVRTAPDDYFPIEKARLLRYHKGGWVPGRDLLTVRR